MTTIRVSTTVDLSKIEGAAKQVPYALETAINESMKKAQTKQRAHMAQVFTIRRPKFADLSVKITQFAKKTTLVGVIAMDPPGAKSDDLFNKFETRTIKKPKDGKNIAIPVVGSSIKRTKQSIVQDKNRPRALLSGATTIQSRGKVKNVKRAKSFGGAFIKPAENGHPAEIFIRKGKKEELAYVLEPYAPIKPVLTFGKTVTAEINRVWASEFDKALKHALATRTK